MNEGRFYRGVGTITSDVAEHMNEVFAAVIRDGPIPPKSELMRHLAVALDDLEDQRMADYAEEVHEYGEEKRQWLERNPKARD